MGTTTLLALEKLLNEAIGDSLEFDYTGISTGTTPSIVASTLANHAWGTSDFFNNRYLYFTEGNNVGKLRQVKDYVDSSTSTGTSTPLLKLRGAALSSDTGTGLRTVRIHRLNRNNKIRALKRAIEQIYPVLFNKLDNFELITGNWLPNAHFERWASSSSLDFYTANSGTLAQTSTAGLARGLTYSAKYTAGAASDYFYISSDTYPRLLDLMGGDVSFYVWAYPEVADDVYIQVYTKQADGTEQTTLKSTTSAPAGEYTLLKLEDQSLNDDLVKVEVRFCVTTNTKYAYFDDALLVSGSVYDYLLPENFQTDAAITKVKVQSSGYSDYICYDLRPKEWGAKEQVSIFEESVNGTVYKWLRFYHTQPKFRRIWIEGYKKLSVPSSDSGTTELDGMRLNLIIAYAAHLLYEMEKGTVSIDDRGTYERESAYWLNKYRAELPNLMMSIPAGTIKTR